MNKFYTSQIITDDEKNDSKNIADKESKITQNKYEQISYNRFNYKSTIPNVRIIIFMMGFCIGMVLFYLSSGNLIDENIFQILLNGRKVTQLNKYNINKELLLIYVSEIRIKQLIFIILCSISSASILFSYLLIGVFGITFGILTFVSIYQNGLLGLLFMIVLIFPHFIFYCYIFFRVFKIYGCVDESTYHNKFVNKNYKLLLFANKIKETVAIMVLFVFGILSETYINSELIKKIVVFL